MSQIKVFSRHGISPPRVQPQIPSELSALTTETKAMLDNIGKISTDLKSVMSEAEQLKVDLKKEKYHREVESVLARKATDPSPLDVYLPAERKSLPSHPKASHLTREDPAIMNAKRVLKEVESRRSNLEANFAAVLRRKDEENFHNFVDYMFDAANGADETLRIRMEVDKKIQEIASTVHREIEIESQKSKEKPDAPTKEKQPLQKQTLNKGYPLRGRKAAPTAGTKKAAPRKMPGKENEEASKPTAKRTKVTKPQPSTKPTPKPAPQPVRQPSAPISSSAMKTYLTSVYGRQPHHPHRTTSKPPYLHYKSPVNPKAAAVVAALLGPQPCPEGGEPDPSVRTSQKRPVDNDRFYFHPTADVSHLPTGEETGGIGAPVEGHLVPMAVPLGKPRRDPSLRIPLPSTPAPLDRSVAMETSTIHHTSTPKADAPARPNVAVINIQEEGTEDEPDRLRRKRRKGADKKKRSGGLGVQILPTVDIDSYTESSSDVTTPRIPTRLSTPEHPVTRPDESEYDELRNYIAVRDTGVEDPEKTVDQSDVEDETTRLPTPDNPLTIQGYSEKERMYHGPAFPPEHPPLPVNNDPGVIEADHRVSDAFEDRAVEWIEQELLARIVSEMNRPLQDPTATTRTPALTPESSIVSESDDGGVLAATIGLGGVQLFVDAGLPVDRDLVAQLIKDVVTEQIAATLGYPKPTATPRTPEPQVDDEVPESPGSTPRGTPLATPIPTPVYTPPESEASESPIVATPERTPTPSEPSSPSESEATLEETPVRETSKVEDETSKVESEVSEVRSPLPTPIATPPSSQTPTVSVSTPEPSVREPEVSTVGTPVSTPQVTVDIPTPPSEPSSISEPEPSKVETPPPPSASTVTTPPKPEVTASPSSIATSTLSTTEGTTTVTTEEDLSEGQLVQPYVHAGQFSEGEYAVGPGLVRLMRNRQLSADLDTGMLGVGEDSRNEMIRAALHGLLRRGKDDEPLTRLREERGESSSSDTSEPTSMASTLRDTTSIREDSLVDASPSEGEIILPKEPSAALLISHMTRPPRPLADEESEGEIRSDVISAKRNRRPDTTRAGKEIDTSGHDVSSGELPEDQSTSAIQSPGEIANNQQPPPPSSALNNIPARFKVRPTTVEVRGQDTSAVSHPDEDTESRSLHTSDLGRTQKVRADVKPLETAPQTRIVVVGRGKSDAAALSQAEENSETRPGSELSEGMRAGVDENGGKSSPEDDIDAETPQAHPTRIQVTIPLMDMHESSANSEGVEPGNEDTFGDVSSISGGDF